MASQFGSGFKYTPPGGSLTTHPAKLRLRAGVAAHVQTRYRSIALDQRTIDVVTIDGGADELQGVIRFDHDPSALLAMLRHGANGVTLTYYPDLDGADSFPFALMNFAEVVEITADPDRFFAREWETTVWLRRVDGGSIDTLISANYAKNPGFEAGTLAPHVALNSGGAWSASTLTGIERTGAWAAQYVPTGQSGTAALEVNGALASPAGHMAVSAGRVATHEAWVRCEDVAPANEMRIQLSWRAANGTEISATDGIGAEPTTTYARIFATGTAPAGAAYVVPRVFVLDDGFTTNVLRVDDMRLMHGSGGA